MNALTDAEKGYIAAIIDRDGRIHGGTGRLRTPRDRGGAPPRIDVGTRRSRSLALWLQNATGVGQVNVQHYSTTPKLYWHWCVCLREAAPLLRELLPYLVVKRRQAELFIEIAALRRLYHIERVTYKVLFRPEMERLTRELSRFKHEEE